MTKPTQLEEGDRVMLIKPDYGMGDPPSGTFGTFKEFDDVHYLVKWDNWTGGMGPFSNHWWMDRNQLRKLPSKRVTEAQQ